MRKKLLWSFLAFCLFFGTAVAQNLTINGKVVDEKGDPISGASVQVKGTRTGATADANGIFSVKAAKGAISITLGRFNTIFDTFKILLSCHVM